MAAILQAWPPASAPPRCKKQKLHCACVPGVFQPHGLMTRKSRPFWQIALAASSRLWRPSDAQPYLLGGNAQACRCLYYQAVLSAGVGGGDAHCRAIWKLRATVEKQSRFAAFAAAILPSARALTKADDNAPPSSGGVFLYSLA